MPSPITPLRLSTPKKMSPPKEGRGEPLCCEEVGRGSPVACPAAPSLVLRTELTLVCGQEHLQLRQGGKQSLPLPFIERYRKPTQPIDRASTLLRNFEGYLLHRSRSRSLKSSVLRK